jgi:SAM-dependent methyltransferase
VAGRQGIIGGMRQEEIWDAEAAGSYDTPGTGMFAPEVLGPTADRLAGLAGSGRALEFAIGTGRVAIPLAERGVPVTGIELSPPMIGRLREKADAETIPVIAGDMATARAPGEYALVYLVFNAISNLLAQGEQVACFRNAARHLAPGGRFVIELWVPELRKLPPGQPGLVYKSEPGYIGLDTYDVLTQHIVSHHFRFGEGRQARLFRSPHRYIWPAELDLMGQLAGFELESRHADWLGGDFTAESRSHVSVYRLPPGRLPDPRGGHRQSGCATSEADLIPVIAASSSLSDVSPDTPTQPRSVPSASLTRTPPGTGMSLPPIAAAADVMK